jgi:hypothetical protein
MDGLNNIVADRGGGIYLGGFFNHFVDGDHLTCAEKMSGQDQDIAIRFMKLSDGYDFPEEEVNRMYQRGGALFIKLEPWSGAGPNDDSFSLENLRSVNATKLIIAFAKSCQDVGKPIFLTFGHEPQITDKYPWGKDPERYKEAFRYVHDLINQYTDKVTWVWNPNVAAQGEDLFKYDPGPGYYKWIALDGYHPRSGGTFKEIFESSLQQVTAKYPDLDIMVGEFASNAPDRTAIFNETFDHLAGTTHRIKAFLYFDVNEEGNNWAVLKPKDKADYAAALQKHDELFRRTIQLEGGATLKRETVEPLKAACSAVEGSWQTLYWQRTVDGINREIRHKEKCFKGIVEFDSSNISFGSNCNRVEANRWHEILAQRYVSLAMLKSDNEAVRDENIKKALDGVALGLKTIDRSDQKASWPYIEKVRYYFDLKMRQAEIFRDYGRVPDSIGLCRQILTSDQLYNPTVRRVHDIDDESVGGITARTRGIMADAMLVLGKEALVAPTNLAGLAPDPNKLFVDLVNSGNLNAKGVAQPVRPDYNDTFDNFARTLRGGYTTEQKKKVFDLLEQTRQGTLTEAMQLFDQVIDWVNKEVAEKGALHSAYTRVKLWWKSGKGEMDLNPKPKIQYVGALAQLGKAEVLIRWGKLNKAFPVYTDLLNWEKVGTQKGGFMDLALKALIGAMVGCMNTGDYKTATESFERGLPWEKINSYQDLKKSLGLEHIDLTTKSAAEKWELFKNRLRLIRLAPRYMDQLQSVYTLEAKK